MSKQKTTRMRLRGKRKSVPGFTMIEVLVTLLVLAIGLLGIAGLQLTGMRSNQSAYTRSQVTVFAYDIIDRMRANRAEASTGAYTLVNVTNVGGLPTGATQTEVDLRNWGTNLLNLLPAADISMGIDANNVVTVTIIWDDSRASHGRTDLGGAVIGQTNQFQFQTELQ